MRAFLRDNHIFLTHSLVFLLVLFTLIGIMDKATLHLALNGFHTPAGDFFFRYFTYVGDWIPYVLVGLLLFYKLGSATFVLTNNLLAGLITQIIKRIVVAPRPKLFFDLANNPDILPLVEGVHLHSTHSFPSGHTTTCFAVFFAIAILLNNKDIHLSNTWRQIWQYLCFLIAVLGSLSRIYLSQHFAADVTVGATIAILTTAALYPLFKLWETKNAKSFNWHIPITK